MQPPPITPPQRKLFQIVSLNAGEIAAADRFFAFGLLFSAGELLQYPLTVSV